MRNSIKAVVFGSLLATMVVSTGAIAEVGDRDGDNATVVHKKTVVKGDDHTAVVHKNVVRHRDGDVVRRDTVVRHNHHHDHPVRVHGVWVDGPAVRVHDDEWYRIHRHHHYRPYYYQNGIRVYYRGHDRRDWGYTRGHHEHRDHDRSDWGHTRGHNDRDHGDNVRTRNDNDRTRNDNDRTRNDTDRNNRNQDHEGNR